MTRKVLCPHRNKLTEISIPSLSASALEDKTNKWISQRIECPFSSQYSCNAECKKTKEN